jgi:hypothetical protein
MHRSYARNQPTSPPELYEFILVSVYYTFAVGGFALGSLTGGLLAHGFGLAAPFWVTAVAVAVVAMLTWRLFTPGHLTAGPAASPATVRRPRP